MVDKSSFEIGSNAIWLTDVPGKTSRRTRADSDDGREDRYFRLRLTSSILACCGYCTKWRPQISIIYR